MRWSQECHRRLPKPEFRKWKEQLLHWYPQHWIRLQHCFEHNPPLYHYLFPDQANHHTYYSSYYSSHYSGYYPSYYPSFINDLRFRCSYLEYQRGFKLVFHFPFPFDLGFYFPFDLGFYFPFNFHHRYWHTFFELYFSSYLSCYFSCFSFYLCHFNVLSSW
jgi:hypothetical protein